MFTRLRLKNFKSWKDTGNIALRPITGFFGPNSSGKSSIFQTLLLMKQTIDSPDRGLIFHFGDRNTPVNLGDFESVIRNHNFDNILSMALRWISHFEVRIPTLFGGGGISEGKQMGFEVQTQQGKERTAESLYLKQMAYTIGRRKFGMRRTSGNTTYELFPNKPRDVSLHEKTEHYGSVGRPFKFYDFPYWADDYFGSDAFTFDLKYNLDMQLQHTYYLGPLRAYPYRIYAGSGAQPPDVGPRGEYVVDALLSSRQHGQRMRVGGFENYTIEEYVALWLKRLGLVYDFRIKPVTESRRLFEVVVQKSPHAAEVLLTDIGFGVSQILPILVLCFYVPAGSVVILDQPDIHLHPSVQAGLADVFIDAWKTRGVQVLFESHSEHLLRRLQRRIAEEELRQQDVGVYFCSIDGAECSAISELAVDKFGNISNWPEDFFGDQFGEIAAMTDAALTRQEVVS